MIVTYELAGVCANGHATQGVTVASVRVNLHSLVNIGKTPPLTLMASCAEMCGAKLELRSMELDVESRRKVDERRAANPSQAVGERMSAFAFTSQGITGYSTGANGDVLDAGPYIDQARAIRKSERLHAIMAAWHYEQHAGPYLRCQRQPCRDLNQQEQG